MERKPSKKQLLQFNLDILKQEHRESGSAEKGYKKLHAAIASKKDDFLFKILRHHSETPDGVYETKELDFRYQTDYLLKFYSLLQIAIMAGYVPARLPEDLSKEIMMILGHPAVNKYYSKNYPVLLPQVILKATAKSRAQKVTGSPALFRELLMADYKEDDDVEAFLFLLDGFSYYGKDIDDFNRLLTNKKKITELLERPRKNETRFEKAFWGFIKYNDYMGQYEELLKKCENELFRSAVWHFRGYWFDNMRALMRGEYSEGIENIKELAAKTTMPQYERNLSEGIKKSKDPEKQFDAQQSYLQWKKDYKQQVAVLQQSIRYNLNSSHSRALKTYLRNL